MNLCRSGAQVERAWSIWTYDDSCMATFKMKKDSKGEYYWILKSDKNGKIIAMSSESYIKKSDAEFGISWTRTNAKDAAYIDETKSY